MTPRVTAADVTLWEELVAAAAHAVARPTQSMEKLERACNRARKAVLPAPPYTADNPYIRLLNVGAMFARQGMAERARDAGRLDEILKAAHAHHPLGASASAASAAPGDGPRPWWDRD